MSLAKRQKQSSLQVSSETNLKYFASRVGLYYGTTSVPVFLLALPRVKKVEVSKYEFAGQILEFIEKAKEKNDTTEVKAWQAVAAFFQSGGKLAWVMLTPFENNLESSLIGKSKGLRQSTGLQGLDRMSTYADLLIVPQIAELHDQKKWKSVFQSIIDSTQVVSSLFAIVDLPFSVEINEIKKWKKTVKSEKAATFYPHFFQPCGQTIPSSCVSAALIQKTDWQEGITESAANKKIHDLSLTPSFQLLPSESEYLNSIGINNYRYLNQSDLRIWGFSSLDSKIDISTSRAKMSLEQAVKIICDSFVFESINDSICEDAELAVLDFFQNLKNVFDQNSKEVFSVNCKKKKNGKDVVLDVQCKFRLPHSVQQVKVGVQSAA